MKKLISIILLLLTVVTLTSFYLINEKREENSLREEKEEISEEIASLMYSLERIRGEIDSSERSISRYESKIQEIDETDPLNVERINRFKDLIISLNLEIDRLADIENDISDEIILKMFSIIMMIE
jgi:chromosome segregation ATPase